MLTPTYILHIFSTYSSTHQQPQSPPHQRSYASIRRTQLMFIIIIHCQQSTFILAQVGPVLLSSLFLFVSFLFLFLLSFSSLSSSSPSPLLSFFLNCLPFPSPSILPLFSTLVRLTTQSYFPYHHSFSVGPVLTYFYSYTYSHPLVSYTSFLGGGGAV
jgi:hypothetical protein